jgi:hypothetical protein
MVSRGGFEPPTRWRRSQPVRIHNRTESLSSDRSAHIRSHFLHNSRLYYAVTGGVTDSIQKAFSIPPHECIMYVVDGQDEIIEPMRRQVSAIHDEFAINSISTHLFVEAERGFSRLCAGRLTRHRQIGGFVKLLERDSILKRC